MCVVEIFMKSQKGYYGQIFLIDTDYDRIFFIWKSPSPPHEFFSSGLKDHESLIMSYWFYIIKCGLRY